MRGRIQTAADAGQVAAALEKIDAAIAAGERVLAGDALSRRMRFRILYELAGARRQRAQLERVLREKRAELLGGGSDGQRG